MKGVEDIPALFEYRRSLDKVINYDVPTREMSGAQEALTKARNYVQSKIDKRIASLDKAIGTDDIKRLKQLNRKYKNASVINSISENAMAKEMTKSAGKDVAAGLLAAGGSLGYQASRGDLDSEDVINSMGIGLLGGLATRGVGRPHQVLEQY